MSNFRFQRLAIPDVVLVTPPRFDDSRGWFMESWRDADYREGGIAARFVQDNQSFSAKAGTLRGMHFQSPPAAQAKLVRVVRGSVFDVAVDLRAGSPSFGRWVSATLTADGGEQMFVPRGFAHGFCTLEDAALVAYRVDAYYAPEHDSGVIWNDPDIGIDWPAPDDALLLSDKDKSLPRLRDLGAGLRL
ncbi:MAG: dTDP-4-dehydrorhamnose 3,5-epimerase [Maricaulaceae bacterium]|nr:dTDP-4-dehydrorhamnose 3,5-epimerase [Maricaulaceae bacterium]